MENNVASTSAIPGKTAGSPAAKTKALLHDSAFLAERGCLAVAKLSGRPLPG